MKECNVSEMRLITLRWEPLPWRMTKSGYGATGVRGVWFDSSVAFAAQQLQRLLKSTHYSGLLLGRWLGGQYMLLTSPTSVRVRIYTSQAYRMPRPTYLARHLNKGNTDIVGSIDYQAPTLPLDFCPSNIHCMLARLHHNVTVRYMLKTTVCGLSSH